MMVEYATRMLSGLPESTEYLSALAKGYLLTGDDSKAIDTWQKILGIDPRNYSALLELGNYYMLTGDTATARRYLQQAQAIHSTPYVARALQ